MKRVLAVTGASGFLGRHVLAALAQAESETRVLVRDPARFPAPPGVTVVRGDLSDAAALSRFCERADTVLHLAGATSGSAADFQTVNVAGTDRVLAAAKAQGCRRFIHVSSLAAKEPDLSRYGQSKAMAEARVNVMSGAMETLIIRPSAVYGEGDKATLPLLRALMARLALLPGTKSSAFSLIHAEDLARILVAACAGEDRGMREVDDTHGPYHWHELVAATQALFDRPRAHMHMPRAAAHAIGRTADFLAALTGRHGMISADKMHQLYHESWVTEGKGWPRDWAIPLNEGLRRTLLAAMVEGELPRRRLVDRRPRHD